MVTGCRGCDGFQRDVAGALDRPFVVLLEAWALIRERFPDKVQGYREPALLLIGRDRSAEALAFLDQANALFPNEPQILEVLVEAARREKDWRAVSKHSEAVIRISPSPQRYLILVDALDRLGLASKAASVLSEAQIDFPENAELIKLHGRLEAKATVMRFQNLGENCEFGLVQRFYAAEPASLLRWSSISAKNLVTLLRSRLAGVGDKEYTGLVVPESTHEYFSFDRRYGMGMHTHIPGTDDYGKTYKETCERLKFLARALIEDLDDKATIFVYQSSPGLADDEVIQIYDAINAYSENFLLYAQPPQKDAAAGSVRRLRERLVVGYVDKLGPQATPEGKAWQVSHDQWLSICKQALDVFDSNTEDSVQVSAANAAS